MHLNTTKEGVVVSIDGQQYNWMEEKELNEMAMDT
jgi:hypothetical protein